MTGSVRTIATSESTISIRPMLERDLADADHVMRLAFGTYLGLPDPTKFLGDANYVHTRWQANPSAAFTAEIDGKLAGSNFASNWGSVGFFGPLTIHPGLWDRGIAKRLIEPVITCFEQWGTRHAGLFTFPHSQKHVALYQKFGFWPKYLTAIMSKPIVSKGTKAGWIRYSSLNAHEQEEMLISCAQLTDSIYEGLHIGDEIQAVNRLGLGDTVLLWNGNQLSGLAVCHYGAGSEAGSGNCYIKFGAVQKNSTAALNFEKLLDACEDMALQSKLAKLTAGINTSRLDAYRSMLGRGFIAEAQGIAMHKSSDAGYDQPNNYVIDDWR